MKDLQKLQEPSHMYVNPDEQEYRGMGHVLLTYSNMHHFSQTNIKPVVCDCCLSLQGQLLKELTLSFQTACEEAPHPPQLSLKRSDLKSVAVKFHLRCLATGCLC